MMKRTCLALVVLLGASVLAVAAKSPDWLSGTSKQYPSESFIIGVGLADTLDGSRSAARAEIAKVFKSRITQSASDMNSEKTSLEKSRAASSSLTASETKTNVSTDELLEGVEIAQTWNDEKKKRYYALAVLDKKKTRQNLSRQLTDLEETIHRHLADAAKSKTTIDGIKALSAALGNIEQRDALAARRRVVDPAAIPDLSGETSRAAVEKQRDDLLKRVVFIVSADEDESLASLISSRITGLGFNVVPAPTAKPAEAMMLTVKGRRTVAAFDRQNPHWKFYNWQAGLTIIDAEGKIVAAAMKDGQSSHITEESAKAKAVAEAGEALAAGAEQEIGKYFFGQ